MTLSNIKKLTTFILFASISLFVACKKENQNVGEIISLPKIEGFYIFKKNMSFKEVTDVLIKNKIKFRIINNDSMEEINSPINFYHHLIFRDNFKDFKTIKWIEGYNLSILDQNLERFQVCFLNDSIFYFSYKNNTQSEYITNSNNKEIISFRNKLKSNLNLLSSLSEGLNFKYGDPQFKISDFDYETSFKEINYKWNDFNSKGKQYLQKEVWFSKDSLMHVELENFFIKDTLKINPPIVKTQLIAEVRVLFNLKYAKIIEDFSRKKDSIKEIKKRAVEREEFDSINNEKIKQFKKL